jgi:hypothetical protein
MFTLFTYDQKAFNDGELLENHLIDTGVGGKTSVTSLSLLASFAIDADDTTNSQETGYLLTWFTDIETKSGDIMHVALPPEITLNAEIAAGKASFVCKGLTSITENGAQCKYDRGEHELQITMSSIAPGSAVGLFKVSVKSMINPPSLRGSSLFPVGRSSLTKKQGIHQTTSEGETVAEFLGKVRIVNDFASSLKGLSSDSIDQGSKDYSVPTNYLIEFKPTSVPAYSVNILLTFPTTIKPAKEFPCNVRCTPSFSSRN